MEGGKKLSQKNPSFSFSACDASQLLYKHIAEMTCNPFRTELTSHTKANNLYETLSLAVDRLSRPCLFCERRLSSEVAGNKTEKTIYEYDNNGNLKTRTKCTLTNDAPEDGIQPSFGLEVIRSKNQGTGSQYLTMYSYDNFNRLISLKEGSTTSTYKYNAQDYRVEKTVGDTTTLYLYEADKVVFETDSTGAEKALNVYGENKKTTINC